MKQVAVLFFTATLSACVSYSPTNVVVYKTTTLSSPIPQANVVVPSSSAAASAHVNASPSIPSSSEIPNVTRHDAGPVAQKPKCDHLVLPAVDAVPVISDKQLAAVNPRDPAAMEKLLMDHVERLHRYTVSLKKNWQASVDQYNKNCSKP